VGEGFDHVREHEEDPFVVHPRFDLVRPRRDREPQGPSQAPVEVLIAVVSSAGQSG
jgi:hypothetical protein